MTEEDKKAIWYLEEVVIDKEDYIKTHAWIGTKALDNIEILLNLMQKQQKEIDKLRNKNKDLLRKLRNRVKEVKKLTKYSLYKKEFSRLNAKTKQKDRQIDLMAEHIKKGCDFDSRIQTKEQINQYFAEQAKEV